MINLKAMVDAMGPTNSSADSRPPSSDSRSRSVFSITAPDRDKTSSFSELVKVTTRATSLHEPLLR